MTLKEPSPEQRREMITEGEARDYIPALWPCGLCGGRHFLASYQEPNGDRTYWIEVECTKVRVMVKLRMVET